MKEREKRGKMRGGGVCWLAVWWGVLWGGVAWCLSGLEGVQDCLPVTAGKNGSLVIRVNLLYFGSRAYRLPSPIPMDPNGPHSQMRK